MRLPSRILLVAGFVSIAGPLHAQAPAPKPAPPAVSGRKTVVSPQPQEVTRAQETPPPPTENAPQPLGFEADLYCFGYLGNLSEAFTVQVKGAENVAEQTDFVTGELLYVD